MARPVTLALVFFISLNAMAGVMINQGIADNLGLDAHVGEDDKIDEQTGDRTVQGGTGTGGGTLADLRNALANQLAGLFGAIFPGLRMLERAGVPSWIVGGILGPLFGIATTLLMLSYLRGWGL